MDKYFMTSDGVKLHYIEEGTGKTIIMIHGWGCAAELFRYQIDALKDGYHVIALDLRGHGDSAQPGYGSRIPRMAKDLEELIESLPDEKVILAGHSMGCCVCWCYMELFGQDKVEKFVLIDEEASGVVIPSWTEEEHEKYGGLFTQDVIFNTLADLKSVGKQVAIDLLVGLFSADVSEEIKTWAAESFRKGDAPSNGDLLLAHAMIDWSTFIPRITVPTLVFGGKNSAMNYKSMEWIGSVIPNAKTYIMEKGSSHFMFIENPEEFNRVMLDFLK